MPAGVGKLTGGFGPAAKEQRQSTDMQKDLAREQAEIARAQLAMAQGLFDDTAGLRGKGIDQLQNFLKTGQVPQELRRSYALPYRTGREDLEAQYSRAREQILSQSPVEGGQLGSMLGDLSMQRAQSVGRLRSDLEASIEAPMRQQLFSAALGVGFGQPPVAMSGINSAMGGIGAASGTFGNVATRAQAEQLEREQRAKEEKQEIGSMVGMGMS